MRRFLDEMTDSSNPILVIIKLNESQQLVEALRYKTETRGFDS